MLETFEEVAGLPKADTDFVDPAAPACSCGSYMIKRQDGWFGLLWRCSRYPVWQFTMPIEMPTEQKFRARKRRRSIWQ